MKPELSQDEDLCKNHLLSSRKNLRLTFPRLLFSALELLQLWLIQAMATEAMEAMEGTEVVMEGTEVDMEGTDTAEAMAMERGRLRLNPLL